MIPSQRIKVRDPKRNNANWKTYLAERQITPDAAKRMQDFFAEKFAGKGVKNAEFIADELMQHANIPYAKAYVFAQRLVMLEAMKKRQAEIEAAERRQAEIKNAAKKKEQ